jgi:biopolymer transport protein ExbD
VWSISLANNSDKSSKQRTIVIVTIVALVLLLIISSVLVTTFVNNTIAINNAHATATAQSNAMVTAQVKATATAIAQATATVQAQAMATATATAIAANPDPYQPVGTLAFTDPLSSPNLWYKLLDTGGECQFVNEAYQISLSQLNQFFDCDDLSEQYSNFTFEVKMTINQGDCGGMDIRDNVDSSSLYLFRICQGGGYRFSKYKSDSDSTILTNGISSAINQGTGQSNTIAVVAKSSNFDLYVNGQKIDSVSDSNDYSQGYVGLVADAPNNATTVTFQDARLWTV